MGWVHRAPEAPQHVCYPPMREAVHRLPSSLIGPGTTQTEFSEMVVDGQPGDLWRCDDQTCGKLWRIGLACPICDRAGRSVPHGGAHVVGVRWWPATWWQRITNRPHKVAGRR
jgi:hypothetical protein